MKGLSGARLPGLSKTLDTTTSVQNVTESTKIFLMLPVGRY